LVIAVLIFTASSRSSVAGPRIAHFDKVVHFSVYGLLGTLACRAIAGSRGAWWALAAVSAYGATDEWHQYFVPGRSSELADWVADTAGAAIAILMYRRWTAYRHLLERPLNSRSALKVE
jgi:VanZ family protein